MNEPINSVTNNRPRVYRVYNIYIYSRGVWVNQTPDSGGLTVNPHTHARAQTDLTNLMSSTQARPW